MIDAIGLKILKILQKKARIPNIEVSRKVGLAPSAVLERIRKLESQGIIDGYEVRLNPEWFNRALIAFVHIDVFPEKAAAIGTQLAAIDDIQEIHFITGHDGFFIKVRCRDCQSLGFFIQQHLQNIDGVLATRTATVLSTIKESSRIPLPHSL